MVVTYRTEELRYDKVYDNIVNGIKNYCVKNGINTLVLGLSGGIDSTVVAALAKASGIKLIGVSLPCSTNKNDEKSAAILAGTEFCDEFKEVNLQTAFECVETFCTSASEKQSTPISQGNIKARIRMITLYDIASKEGAIVLDTDNLTEHFLGFYTIHGDDSDFNPIGGLWKHEVYGLAKWMHDNVYKQSKALQASIELMPTDGNGVKEGGDLAQIAPGKTYDDVDEILHAWVGLNPKIKDSYLINGFDYGTMAKMCEKHGYDTVKNVVMRSVKSEFKRKHRPFIVNIFNGDILEKNGNIYTY
jgi:NAD+ synthetase